ncbi:hypothetical protein HNY73_013066 [Argiope bruennichi]|uniref:Uncharacterized protein n=1 Tax=Argiope bruennichi TaxID=94029 RepID=A0A8T0EXK1_ARGBR|nr:hypothetical protein HNY73_013066 [Argiope bruennichi]
MAETFKKCPDIFRILIDCLIPPESWNKTRRRKCSESIITPRNNHGYYSLTAMLELRIGYDLRVVKKISFSESTRPF